MATFDPPPFRLVEMPAVANARNERVAPTLTVDASGSAATAAWRHSLEACHRAIQVSRNP